MTRHTVFTKEVELTQEQYDDLEEGYLLNNDPLWDIVTQGATKDSDESYIDVTQIDIPE